MRSDKLTPKQRDLERLQKQQQREIDHYLRTGRPPEIVADLRPRPPARKGQASWAFKGTSR